MSTTLASDTGHRGRPVLRRTVLIGVVVALLALVVVLKWDDLPSGAAVVSAFIGADLWWVGATMLLTAVSIGLVSRQQRLLMAAFGVPVRPLRMGAITTAGAAISMVVPAGGAVAGGYAFREFRRSGARASVAATVMVLSGALAAVGLGIAALLIPAVAWSWTSGPLAAVLLTLIGLAVFTVWIAAPRWKGRTVEIDAPAPRLEAWGARHPRLLPAAREVLRSARRTAALDGAELRAVMVPSIAKWILDAGALWTACLAVGITVDPLALLVMYLGVQVLRQVPLTPGGTGLVEAALLTGLTASGATAVLAAAAILIYRLISAWAVVAVGGFAALWLARRPTLDPAELADAEVEVGRR